MGPTSLQELYVDELKDLYSAEQQILKALPRMIRKASHRELKRAFTLHERQTQGQVRRLERIFKDLDEKPGGKKCHGMEGLIEEAKELISEGATPDVLDAGLIAKAQHVEHYEMAGYGTVRTYARLLGYDQHAELLQQTLDEEGETDKLLTALADEINVEAEDDSEADLQGGRGGRGGARKTAAKKGGRKAASKRKTASRR